MAQRRIAWRWVTWYFQRFSPHALAVLTVLVGAAYLRGSLPSWSGGGDPHDTASAAVVHAPYSPPAVPTAPAPVPQPPPADTAPDLESPLTLRTSLALGAHAAAPSPYPGTETSPDTLSLKPENWLHSKEP